MKKYILLAITALITISLFNPFSAKAEDQTVNDVLNSIMQAQNITDNTKIDCSKVTQQQFIDLGDAVMGLMSPNQQSHDYMDQMMGGEGSASLNQAHTIMGERYLGCYSTSTSNIMNYGYYGGMMGNYGGMMGWGYNNMMGYGYHSSGFWIINILGVFFFIFIILGIIALLKYIFKNNKPKS